MAVKILPIRKISSRVSLNAFLSSISSAIQIQSTPEIDENHSNSSTFEEKIQFLKDKLHPDSLITVLDSTPDLNSSLRLFEWAALQKRFLHTGHTYQSMILKLGMAGNVEKMEEFCHEMAKEKFPGFADSFLMLLDSFVRNQRLNEALRVLYVMNLTSFKPSLETFNALMGALVYGKKDFKDVLFVFKEMVKAGVLPNIDTLNYLLEALFEDGRVDTAVDQYVRMHKKGCVPNSRTFEILISSLATRNRVEDSIVILNEMFQLGCEPDSRFYARVIPLFCGLQNQEIGMRLFKMLKASGFAPDVVIYRTMIRCLCENLFMDDAIKLFEEMMDISFSADKEVNLDIIRGFCKLNKFDEAKKLLDEKNVMDACVHNALLESYCNSGNFLVAKKMFDEMVERNIVDTCSWNIFLTFLSERTGIDRALEYLSTMVVSSFIPDSATYSALIVGHCNKGNFKNALELFRRVRLRDWLLDSLSYVRLVECLCQREKTREAAEVFLYMSSKGCALQSTSFSLLIDKICAHGKVDIATMLLSLAHGAGMASSVATYKSILCGLSKSYQKHYVLVVLSQMIVVGCTFDKETYCILIQSMAALNRIGDCITVFNLMLLEDLLPDSETLAFLFCYLASHLQMHSIYPLIKKLVSKAGVVDSAMYDMLVNGLWREGWKCEARHMVDLMLEKGWVPNASTHALIMGGSVGRKEAMVKDNLVKRNGKKGTSLSTTNMVLMRLGDHVAVDVEDIERLVELRCSFMDVEQQQFNASRIKQQSVDAFPTEIEILALERAKKIRITVGENRGASGKLSILRFRYGLEHAKQRREMSSTLYKTSRSGKGKKSHSPDSSFQVMYEDIIKIGKLDAPFTGLRDEDETETVSAQLHSPQP
ncbi:pentatricopeptide repeat-containing protein chloroplastic-like [Dorcoceras hygrometricum]|nr:pentatricopeptide repeat-containing protein chloroplastic-like [Dorcoceras hygrometricum]